MEYEYTLEQLEVYQMAESFSDVIWSIVLTFDQFKRDTIGKQIVRSADSVSANIAEGYGRFYFAESKQFYYYARGSLQETKAWLSKCKRRRLVESSLIDQLTETAELILIKLNAYIRFVANSPKHNRRD